MGQQADLRIPPRLLSSSLLLDQLEAVENHVLRKIRRGEDLQDAHSSHVHALKLRQLYGDRGHSQERCVYHVMVPELSASTKS